MPPLLLPLPRVTTTSSPLLLLPDLANVVLVLCMLYVSSKWSENYGQSDGQS